jgi:hypothetical protein
MITENEKLKVEEILKIEGEKVVTSGNREMYLSNGFVLYHESLLIDFSNFKVHSVGVNLNDQNTISIRIIFQKSYKNQGIEFSFDLNSSDEVDKFIKNCKTQTTSKKFDL